MDANSSVLKVRVPSPAKPRVRNIRIRVVDHDQHYAIGAILILIIPGTVLMMYVAPWIAWKIGPVMAVTAMFLMVCLSIIVATIVLQFLQYSRRSRIPFRVDRLKSIHTRANSAQRLPHRWVEHLCHNFARRSLGINRELSLLSSGEVILVNLAHYETGTSPWELPSGDVSFEPIQWKGLDSRMRELLSAATENQAHAWDRKTEADKDRIIGAHRPWVTWRSFVGMPVIIASVSIGVKSAASLGSILVVFLVPLAIVVARHVLVGRLLYFVPGGVVRIKNGLLYRKPQLELLTAGNASLVLYADGGCHIVTQKGAERVSSSTDMNRAMLLAWTSTARTPTIDELRALLVADHEAFD